MRKVFFVGLMLASAVVSAETILVEPGDGHWFVGDKFDARSVNQVLYADRPCNLPLVNAKDMREYTTKLIAIPQKLAGGG